MRIFLFGSLALMLSSVLLSSCKKDADPDHEEELITTMILTWTPDGAGAPVTFTFRDLDGEGGNPPFVISAPLSANTEYTLDITVLNESVSPAEDITAEILAEADEHQFFFATTPGVNLAFAYLDTDSNGAALGLQTRMVLGEPSSGELQVTLLHEPNKGAAGVPQGDPTNAGGETDIEVVFDIDIQ